jgi:DUF1365 family protein
LNSCIYEGLIRHRRNAPKKHEFDFRSFLFLLDLDELETVFKRRWLWSTSKFAFARFRQDRHLIADPNTPSIRCRAENVLKEHGVVASIGAIRLLTQLNYLGFEMNPVSFFYCYNQDNSRVEAIIAEVNNTPWGEQHVYVVPANQESGSSGSQPSIHSDWVDKVFHVSPFLSMEMGYRMAFSLPGAKLGVKIENHLDHPMEGVRKILDVSMSMKRLDLTSSNLNRLLVKYPFASVKVFVGIYWQALRLYLKKIPVFSHLGNSTPTAPDLGTQAMPLSGDSSANVTPQSSAYPHPQLPSNSKTVLNSK